MDPATAPFAGPGKLNWIGLRAEKRGPVRVTDCVEAQVGTGLVGDHENRVGSRRQVTLYQAEHLQVLQALLPGEVGPEMLRRNLLISGINLHALQDRRFRVGAVLLEGSGDCPPCEWMEKNLGPGGYQAMVGHGGITARVLEGGTLRVGDPVELAT